MRFGTEGADVPALRSSQRENQFAIGETKRKFKAMSTIQEIEAAIQSLPPEDREKLIKDLPSILPNWMGMPNGIVSFPIRLPAPRSANWAMRLRRK